MNIALTGGGTAGHIIPNLALLPELRTYFKNVYYFGGKGMEAELVPDAGIPFYATDTVKLERTKWWKNFKIPYILHKSVAEATKIMQDLQIDVVFCKGGYAALPASLAAKKLNIPVVVHESDYTLGVANKLVSRFAVSTLTSFPETGGTYVGNPVRQELFSPDSCPFPLDKNFPVVLIFGGSLGAKALNEAVWDNLRALTDKYNVIHITGKKQGGKYTTKRYFPLRFTDDMASLYAAADVVVMRGGANSLSEGAALGKRILCVPLPKGESRGDQLANATSYQKAGLADVLLQSDLTGAKLMAKIDALLRCAPPLSSKNDANEAIARELERVASKKKSN